jgi:hypothetical protein
MLEATLNNVGVSSNVAAKIPNQIPAPFSNCRRLRLATAGDDEAHTVARFVVRFFHEMYLQARRAQLAIVPNRASSVASGFPRNACRYGAVRDRSHPLEQKFDHVESSKERSAFLAQ